MNKSLFIKAIRLIIPVFALYAALSLHEASAQTDTGITLRMDNVRLESVIDAIEQQSKYLFLNDQVDLDRTVSINVSNAGIEEVLDRLFEGADIRWRIEGTNIYISRETPDIPTGGGQR